MEKSVLVITTGGTIDAERHPVVEGKVVPPPDVTVLPQSGVQAYIHSSAWARRCQTESFAAEDSKYLNNQELINLAARIREAPQQRILVTMGTDQMAHHAAALER